MIYERAMRILATPKPDYANNPDEPEKPGDEGVASE
jgi:hypothetical protein